MIFSKVGLDNSSLKNPSNVQSSESGILFDNNGNNENNLISEPVFKSDSKLVCVLQNINYKMLSSTDFNIAIVDPDDSKLSTP